MASQIDTFVGVGGQVEQLWRQVNVEIILEISFFCHVACAEHALGVVFGHDDLIREGVSAQRREEASSPQSIWNWGFGEVQQGGHDVDEADVLTDASALCKIRSCYYERHAHRRFVEALLLPDSMLPGHFAVIAEIDDHSVFR